VFQRSQLSILAFRTGLAVLMSSGAKFHLILAACLRNDRGSYEAVIAALN